jgi:hypothetical protein
MGDPLARFRSSSVGASSARAGYDPDLNMGGLAFYLWPLKSLVFCKPYSLDLIVLLITGLLAWRLLDRSQRMLLTITFLIYFYLGYGTMVPWKYLTLFRQYHYYGVLVLGVAALLPATISRLVTRPRWMAPLLIGGLIALQVLLCATGSRWGQSPKNCRALLVYTRAHPDRLYLADPSTFNTIYALNGFCIPENIRCRNSPETLRFLMVNKEPVGTPPVRFPARPVDGVLIDRERHDDPQFVTDPGFQEFLDSAARHPERRTITVAPERYRPLFRPLVGLVGVRGFMIQSLGGEVVEFATPESPDVPAPAQKPVPAGAGG